MSRNLPRGTPGLLLLVFAALLLLLVAGAWERHRRGADTVSVTPLREAAEPPPAP